MAVRNIRRLSKKTILKEIKEGTLTEQEYYSVLESKYDDEIMEAICSSSYTPLSILLTFASFGTVEQQRAIAIKVNRYKSFPKKGKKMLMDELVHSPYPLVRRAVVICGNLTFKQLEELSKDDEEVVRMDVFSSTKTPSLIKLRQLREGYIQAKDELMEHLLSSFVHLDKYELDDIKSQVDESEFELLMQTAMIFGIKIEGESLWQNN